MGSVNLFQNVQGSNRACKVYRDVNAWNNAVISHPLGTHHHKELIHKENPPRSDTRRIRNVGRRSCIERTTMSEGGATGEEGFTARTRKVESAGLYAI